jgi:hypothetical protein
MPEDSFAEEFGVTLTHKNDLAVSDVHERLLEL